MFTDPTAAATGGQAKDSFSSFMSDQSEQSKTRGAEAPRSSVPGETDGRMRVQTYMLTSGGLKM